MATYAYHLPVGDDNQKINFGLSLGFMNERIDNSELNGDPSDVYVGRFNQRETFIDGDFGVAYVGNKLTLQGSLRI